MQPSSDRKRKARILANLAEEYGFLTRRPCETCGAPSDHKHHEDYNRPLDIVWLCRRCHIDIHVAERNDGEEGVIAVLKKFLTDG